MTQQAKIRVEE